MTVLVAGQRIAAHFTMWNSTGQGQGPYQEGWCAATHVTHASTLQRLLVKLEGVDLAAHTVDVGVL